MFHIRALFDIFTGRKPVEALSDERIDLKTGLLSFALAFFVTFILVGIEYFMFTAISGLLGHQGIVPLVLSLVVIAVGTAIGSVVGYVALVVFSYVWGAIHYAIIKHYTNTPEKLNDFNGALLVLFSSVRLAEGILFLIPVLGWFLAVLVHVYSVVPVYKFVRNRFSLSDAKAAIVVLLPLTLLFLAFFILSVMAAVILVGAKLFGK